MNYVFFEATDSPFSNFYPSKFSENGIDFISSEQYMMYQKAIFFKDEQMAQRILDINDQTSLAKDFLNGKINTQWILAHRFAEWEVLQYRIKDLGKKVSNYNKTWSQHREEIVGKGIFEKCVQNEEIKQALLATGDDMIVEATKEDKIWGIGLDEHEAKIIPFEKWEGKNLLGKVLMDVRCKILKLNEKN